MIERKAVSRDQEVASGLQFPHSRGTVKVIIDGFSKCDQFFNIQAKRLQGRNKKNTKLNPVWDRLTFYLFICRLNTFIYLEYSVKR